MSSAAERTALGTLFNTEWANRTPVAWPNRKYDPVVGTAWVRFSVIQADGFRTEFGSPGSQHRFLGTVFVQVFAPTLAGDGPALALGDQAAAILRSRSLTVETAGRILLRTPTVRAVGEDQGWFQVNVSCPYLFDVVF